MLSMLFVFAAISAPWQSIDDAIVEAVADAEEHSDDAPHLVYVWSPSGSQDLARLVSFTANSALAEINVPAVMRPVMISDHVLRIDLRAVGTVAGRRKILDEFATDLRIYERRKIDSVPPVPVVSQSGTVTSPRPQSAPPPPTYEILFGSHLSPESIAAGERLQKLTAAKVPFVEANEFIRRLNDDIADGLYSKSLGIPSDYDEYQKLFGIDEAASAKADAERQAVLAWSNVTRSQRAISFFPILGAGVDRTRVWAVTRDLGKEDRKADQQPLLNLLAVGDPVKRLEVAREGMVDAVNGRIVWTLWAVDAQGKATRAQSVPDNIAANSRLTPDDRRLRSQISCLECHLGREGQTEYDGWRPWQNDGKELLPAVVADKKVKDAAELERKLRARHDWDPEASLRAWRTAFAVFVAQCDPFPPAGEPPSKQTPTQLGDLLRKWSSEYTEGAVTPIVAARELGIEAADDTAAAKLLEERIGEFDTADPILLLLIRKTGRVTRLDWNASWPEAWRIVWEGRELPK